MSLQMTIQGTLKADGTLDLDDKVPMPPGRVLVTVQPTVQPEANDPFWRMLEEIWAGQKARGHVPRNTEEVEAERRALREESELEIQEALRLHLECQRLRRDFPPPNQGAQ